MTKKLYEVMAQQGEDDSSHLLTTVYSKFLDLRAEKIKLNSSKLLFYYCNSSLRRHATLITVHLYIMQYTV